jgi:hypothetical protein
MERFSNEVLPHLTIENWAKQRGYCIQRLAIENGKSMKRDCCNNGLR